MTCFTAPLRLSVRPNPLLAHIWSKPVAGRMAPFDHIWRDCFSGRARRAVRKAERAGLTIERGNSDALISDFLDLYNGWITRRARERHIPRAIPQMRAERQRKFRLVGRHLGQRCRVLLARLDGRPVASVILLLYKNWAIYWRGYSDLELTRRTAANNLLHRIAIEDVAQRAASSMTWGSLAELLHSSPSKRNLVHVPERLTNTRPSGFLRGGLGVWRST
jgi:Acetyltransferase (GNAT) domain